MPTVPPYLAEFGDEDARWLHQHGVQRRVSAGERVITEGVLPKHVFVVLEGELVVSSQSLNDPEMMRVRAGELLGESSYLKRMAPGASVLATAESVLLAIRREDLDAKIADDPAFGGRFRKVVSEFAENRTWTYTHPGQDPPSTEPDPYADLRVHELIEKLLRGEF